MVYEGADAARAGPGRARRDRAVPTSLVVAPSNPYVVDPPDPRRRRRPGGARRPAGPLVAVSPLIGGRAVKGPLDRMLTRMAGGTSPAHVAGATRG